MCVICMCPQEGVYQSATVRLFVDEKAYCNVSFQALKGTCVCVYSVLKDEYFNNFLNDLSTSWTRSLELMQPPCTWKTGKQVSRTSVYDISIAWSHSTELARF